MDTHAPLTTAESTKAKANDIKKTAFNQWQAAYLQHNNDDEANSTADKTLLVPNFPPLQYPPEQQDPDWKFFHYAEFHAVKKSIDVANVRGGKGKREHCKL